MLPLHDETSHLITSRVVVKREKDKPLNACIIAVVGVGLVGFVLTVCLFGTSTGRSSVPETPFHFSSPTSVGTEGIPEAPLSPPPLAIPSIPLEVLDGTNKRGKVGFVTPSDADQVIHSIVGLPSEDEDPASQDLSTSDKPPSEPGGFKPIQSEEVNTVVHNSPAASSASEMYPSTDSMVVANVPPTTPTKEEMAAYVDIGENTERDKFNMVKDEGNMVELHQEGLNYGGASGTENGEARDTKLVLIKPEEVKPIIRVTEDDTNTEQPKSKFEPIRSDEVTPLRHFLGGDALPDTNEAPGHLAEGSHEIADLETATTAAAFEPADSPLAENSDVSETAVEEEHNAAATASYSYYLYSYSYSVELSLAEEEGAPVLKEEEEKGRAGQGSPTRGSLRTPPPGEGENGEAGAVPAAAGAAGGGGASGGGGRPWWWWAQPPSSAGDGGGASADGEAVPTARGGGAEPGAVAGAGAGAAARESLEELVSASADKLLASPDFAAQVASVEHSSSKSASVSAAEEEAEVEAEASAESMTAAVASAKVLAGASGDGGGGGANAVAGARGRGEETEHESVGSYSYDGEEAEWSYVWSYNFRSEAEASNSAADELEVAERVVTDTYSYSWDPEYSYPEYSHNFRGVVTKSSSSDLYGVGDGTVQTMEAAGMVDAGERGGAEGGPVLVMTVRPTPSRMERPTTVKPSVAPTEVPAGAPPTGAPTGGGVPTGAPTDAPPSSYPVIPEAEAPLPELAEGVSLEEEPTVHVAAGSYSSYDGEETEWSYVWSYSFRSEVEAFYSTADELVEVAEPMVTDTYSYSWDPEYSYPEYSHNFRGVVTKSPSSDLYGVGDGTVQTMEAAGMVDAGERGGAEGGPVLVMTVRPTPSRMERPTTVKPSVAPTEVPAGAPPTGAPTGGVLPTGAPTDAPLSSYPVSPEAEAPLPELAEGVSLEEEPTVQASIAPTGAPTGAPSGAPPPPPPVSQAPLPGQAEAVSVEERTATGVPTEEPPPLPPISLEAKAALPGLVEGVFLENLTVQSIIGVPTVSPTDVPLPPPPVGPKAEAHLPGLAEEGVSLHSLSTDYDGGFSDEQDIPDNDREEEMTQEANGMNLFESSNQAGPADRTQGGESNIATLGKDFDEASSPKINSFHPGPIFDVLANEGKVYVQGEKDHGTSNLTPFSAVDEVPPVPVREDPAPHGAVTFPEFQSGPIFDVLAATDEQLSVLGPQTLEEENHLTPLPPPPPMMEKTPPLPATEAGTSPGAAPSTELLPPSPMFDVPAPKPPPQHQLTALASLGEGEPPLPPPPLAPVASVAVEEAHAPPVQTIPSPPMEEFSSSAAAPPPTAATNNGLASSILLEQEEQGTPPPPPPPPLQS